LVDKPQAFVTDPVVLERLGLRCGEPIRFKRNGSSRWVQGRISGIAADGSIQLFDPDGAARNLRAHAVEVRRPGVRGRLQWRVVSEVATTWEQLELW
jgi:hypothetical protein